MSVLPTGWRIPPHSPHTCDFSCRAVCFGAGDDGVGKTQSLLSHLFFENSTLRPVSLRGG